MEAFREIRNYTFPECRANGVDDEVLKIGGFGAVTDRWYDVWGFRERIAPGAFRKTLQENPDIRGMFNHNPDFLLGRTKSGTMDVEETSRGLRYEIRADREDPQALSVFRKIKRGDVDGSSMAFLVHVEEWEEKDGRPVKRTITELELIETGPVTMPASPSTTAKILRSAERTGFDIETLESLVVKKRAGFSLEASDCDFIDRTIRTLERLKSGPQGEDSEHLDRSTVLGHGAAAMDLRGRELLAALS